MLDTKTNRLKNDLPYQEYDDLYLDQYQRYNFKNRLNHSKELIDAFGKKDILDILEKQLVLNKAKLTRFQTAFFYFLGYAYSAKFRNWLFNKKSFSYMEKISDNGEHSEHCFLIDCAWIILEIQEDFYNWQMTLYLACKRRNREYPDIDRITDERVAMAKQVPLETLLDGEVNRAGFILCPFHSEKTPSMKVYRDQNTWYCFSCQRGSDSIDLVMELHGLSFIEAVRYLA